MIKYPTAGCHCFVETERTREAAAINLIEPTLLELVTAFERTASVHNETAPKRNRASDNCVYRCCEKSFCEMENGFF